MKYLCLIFIFYLSLSPWQSYRVLAAQDFSCSFAEAEQINLYTDSESDETGDCSEFCVCSGYESAAVEINSIFSFNNKFTVFTEKSVENSYQNQYSQNHLDSIWQPPKINFTV